MDDEALPLVLIGAGGHAKVVLSLARAAGRKVLGVCDPALVSQCASEWNGLPVLGDDEALLQQGCSTFELANGLGQLVGSDLRTRVYERFANAGYQFATLVHPTAWVALDATLGLGVQVMAGAIVQPATVIGENSVINTRASVDHDCVIGAHVHIAPGATLCGSIRLDDGVFIGAGAVLIQGLRIGRGAVVGAGVTLTRDLERERVVLGAPNRLKAH